jgi:hypothetical protein
LARAGGDAPGRVEISCKRLGSLAVLAGGLNPFEESPVKSHSRRRTLIFHESIVAPGVFR